MAEEKKRQDWWDKAPGKSSLQFVNQNGLLIRGNTGIETFCYFIIEMGWERVRDLNFVAKGDNLITQDDHDDPRNYREIAPGWYLYCGYRGVSRLTLMRKIASSLGEKVTCSFADQ